VFLYYYSRLSDQLVAAFSSHLECLVLLLARGASTAVLNNSNLTARQEAKGTAMDIFAIFEVEVC
jgi:hypothetical protein